MRLRTGGRAAAWIAGRQRHRRTAAREPDGRSVTGSSRERFWSFTGVVARATNVYGVKRMVYGVNRIVRELLLALWGLRSETDPPPRVLFER